ncbi:MAG: BamA/TamA family outer membrane protein, partial [Gemmatimonadaceae bacterium]
HSAAARGAAHRKAPALGPSDGMIAGGWRGVAWRRVALTAALLVAAPGALHAQGVECEAGEREVRSLEFSGNTKFRSSDLAQRVVTTPSELARRALRIVGAKRCLDSDALRLDVGRLRVFYRRHGYFSARVDTVVAPVKDAFGGVNVRFVIREGEPVVVDSLRITGLEPVIASIVDTSSLSLHPGIVFDVTILQAGIDSMKARLRNSGYPRADVAATYTGLDTIRKRAAVNLEVLPGALANIGAIHVRVDPLPGAPRRLSDRTILGLMGLKQGDLYRERELIDAQRTLYQTDLFRHVDVGIAVDSSATRVDSIVALDVHVEENFFRQLDTEEGWAVLDCFKARVQLIDKSFLGEARRLELTGQVSKIGYGTPTRIASGNLCAPAIRADTFSARLNYFAGATLRLPSLFGVRASPSLSVYSERRGEYQAFLRTTLIGGEASVTRELWRGIPARLAYSLEYGRTDAQPALFCALFNRCDSQSRALITDRNRPLAVASVHVDRLRTDNPINPRAGTALRVDLRGAAKEIGSDKDIQFVKGLGDGSVYRAIGSSVTLAARVRLGAVVGRTLSLSDSVGFIPPQERLYAGGAASVRGYQQNELGDLIYISEQEPTISQFAPDSAYISVSDSAHVRRAVPVGGNSLIVFNFEVRMKSFFYPELIQYTLFADAGDVWQRGRASQTSTHKRSALYLNGLKWTPGIGVRVFTPVGPFQANVGYNPFARPPGAIYFDKAPNAAGFAPLYCVTPGNRIVAVRGTSGEFEQPSGSACPATFQPGQSRTFLSRLTFTFSIGPDF